MSIKSCSSIVLALCAAVLVASCAAYNTGDEGAVSGSSQPPQVWWPSGPNPDSAYGPVNRNIAH